MNRSILSAVALLATVTTLAACSGGAGNGDGPPPPSEPEATVLAMNIGDAPVHEDRLAAGQTDYFQFTAPIDVDDIIVIELNADLRLDLTDGVAGIARATSTSADMFGPAIVALGAGGQLGSQAIATTAPCRGSCIVVEGDPGTYTFEVTNRGAAAVDYEVFVYDRVATDTLEPNDTLASASPYVLNTENEGAIETVGDVDYWVVQAGGFAGGDIQFEAAGDIDLVLYIDGLGFPSGSTISVEPGDVLRVESESSLAARGNNGYYYLSPVTVTQPLAD